LTKRKTVNKIYGDIIDSGQSPVHKLLIGIPATGNVRIEWAMHRYGQASPTNWSLGEQFAWLDQFSPLRYTVADARNLIAHRALVENRDWIFFVDHDVMLPPGTLIKMDRYMHDAKYPIVSGLYFTKSKPAEPLIYRGLGTGYLRGWRLGKKVWATGTGLGCTLIHTKIFKAFAKHCDEYIVRGQGVVKKFFRSPCSMTASVEDAMQNAYVGTEDLDFYDRIHKEKCYADAGWPVIQRKKFPILIDTSIFCRHIDPSGRQYPMYGEEREFV
jgi:hypothetical protein